MRHRAVDRKRSAAVRLAALLTLAALGCSSPTRLSREELLDPETCMQCHPQQYREWASSMHAYAADDPVFLAMNELGQRETGGELGDFCVTCHAPMALREGATTDGLNLRELPQHLKGVTCFFCHSVEAVTDDHNNPLELATDLAMRGEYADPIESNAHDSIYSELLDRRQVAESSAMCGSCHDIVLPNGVHLERTYLEWQESVFDKPVDQGGLSCGGCHMEGTDDVIADVEGVPLRRRKEHAWPGVDIAITPWPDQEIQLAGIERDLFGAILPKLCFNPNNGGQIEYTLDNVFGGHMLPSGATQDRRMWASLTASAGGATIFESGQVPDGVPVRDVAEVDPTTWRLHDFAVDADGQEALFFWEIEDLTSELLPPAVTNDPTDPRFNHSVTRTFGLEGAGAPDRIEAQVHIRPMGLEILEALAAADVLAPELVAEMPTFDITGTRLVWTPEAAGADGCVDPNSSAE